MHDDGETLTPLSGADGASDQELLRQYAVTGAEAAFGRLVERHVALVYSAALRQTANHAMAQDATQAVFIILARKAAALRRETVLSGWLFRAVRYAALDASRIEARRKAREQAAAHIQQMDSVHEAEREWEQLAPLLDEAMASLNLKDRHVLLMRFFEKKSFGEIGAVLGGNENSARARVLRAIEKLRKRFRRRGVVVSAVALTSTLFTHAVLAAPPGLGWSLARSATSAGPATGAVLAEALLRRLRWNQVIQAAPKVALLLWVLGAAIWAFRQPQAPPAATSATAPRSLRDTVIAIDRAFLNDPDEFVSLIYFRSAEEEQFKPVLTNYVRAESAFRREMKRAFNVQQRTFDAAFRELCVGQPPVLTNYIGLDRASTNVMIARYPLHLVKVAGAWYWDWFGGLSRMARDERRQTLVQMARTFDDLTRRVREATATNVVEILQALPSGSP